MQLRLQRSTSFWFATSPDTKPRSATCLLQLYVVAEMQHFCFLLPFPSLEHHPLNHEFAISTDRINLSHILLIIFSSDTNLQSVPIERFALLKSEVNSSALIRGLQKSRDTSQSFKIENFHRIFRLSVSCCVVFTFLI